MRKQIRDQIRSMLAPVLLSENPHIQLFCYQKGTLETGDPAVSIYFNTGDVTSYIDSSDTEGQLNISILMPDQPDIDDHLDHLADLAQNTLSDDLLLSGLLIENRHTRWQYDRTSFPGWTGLTLTYALNY